MIFYLRTRKQLLSVCGGFGCKAVLLRFSLEPYKKGIHLNETWFYIFIYGTLIITLCLLSSILCLPVSASVPEPGNMDMVYSQMELMNWFDTHPNGGEIALGNNIDAGKYLTLNAISPVTIHMNGYGFKIPQHGFMSISGEVTMISIDNPQPVIESATATNISFSKSVKIKVVNGCGISFMGSADSELVSGDSSCLISSFFNMSVSGRESIGIKSNGNISLNSFNITLSKAHAALKPQETLLCSWQGSQAMANRYNHRGQLH